METHLLTFTTDFYWSSTTYALNADGAWDVNMYDGVVLASLRLAPTTCGQFAEDNDRLFDHLSYLIILS